MGIRREVGQDLEAPSAAAQTGSLKPWQVDSGPEDDLRTYLLGTESRVRAMGVAVFVIAVAVLWFGDWVTLTPSPIGDGWGSYRAVAASLSLALVAVGGVGLLFLLPWGRWAMMPVFVVSALGAASWMFATLEKDTATPEDVAASTPAGRQAVITRGVLWIVAAALPPLLISSRRTRAVCSAEYRFAVNRTSRPTLALWMLAWIVVLLTISWGLAQVEIDLQSRMPTGWLNFRGGR